MNKSKAKMLAQAHYFRVELHLEGKSSPLFNSDANNLQAALQELRDWAAKDYPKNPEKEVKAWMIIPGTGTYTGKAIVRELKPSEITTF